MEAILVLAHGSKRNETEQTLNSIVQKVRHKIGSESVYPAYLKFSAQDMETIIKQLVEKGVIINKFRGDVDILKPGLKMLEDMIKVPVLGVVPCFKLSIDDEDSAALEGKDACNSLTDKSEIEIAVAKLPRMSNFTDFRVLEMIPSVKLKYVQKQNDLYNADLIIIPGSKNTIEDLVYLRNSGIEERIKQLNKKGVPVMGICGGVSDAGDGDRRSLWQRIKYCKNKRNGIA